MSRRFGRNQKRAMRSALVEFGKQLEYTQNTVNSLRQQMYSNEQALRLVASILGDDFVGLEPRTIKVDSLDRPYYPFQPRSSMDKFNAFADPGDLADAVACSVLEIEPNRAKVVYYEEQIRFHLMTPAGEAAYGMSRQAWERMPADAKNTCCAVKSPRPWPSTWSSGGSDDETPSQTSIDRSRQGTHWPPESAGRKQYPWR